MHLCWTDPSRIQVRRDQELRISWLSISTLQNLIFQELPPRKLRLQDALYQRPNTLSSFLVTPSSSSFLRPGQALARVWLQHFRVLKGSKLDRLISRASTKSSSQASDLEAGASSLPWGSRAKQQSANEVLYQPSCPWVAARVHCIAIMASMPFCKMVSGLVMHYYNTPVLVMLAAPIMTAFSSFLPAEECD